MSKCSFVFQSAASYDTDLVRNTSATAALHDKQLLFSLTGRTVLSKLTEDLWEHVSRNDGVDEAKAMWENTKTVIGRLLSGYKWFVLILWSIELRCDTQKKSVWCRSLTPSELGVRLRHLGKFWRKLQNRYKLLSNNSRERKKPEEYEIEAQEGRLNLYLKFECIFKPTQSGIVFSRVYDPFYQGRCFDLFGVDVIYGEDRTPYM